MVRAFTDAPVADAAVERIIAVAQRAPSAGYSQGVEFVVVTDSVTRQEIGRRDGGASPGSGPPSFVAQAPVLVVICVSAEIYAARYREPDKVAARRGMSGDDFWAVPYWHTDAGCALMLILLAAVDEGLAAGFIGIMGEAAQARLRALLAIPDAFTAIGVVALGHEAPDARAHSGSARARPRRPVADVLHRERW